MIPLKNSCGEVPDGIEITSSAVAVAAEPWIPASRVNVSFVEPMANPFLKIRGASDALGTKGTRPKLPRAGLSCHAAKSKSLRGPRSRLTGDDCSFDVERVR